MRILCLSGSGRSLLATVLVVLVVLVALVAGPARAQCPLPDNLDAPPGACCMPVTPVFPTFPAFTHTALDICWKDCAVDATGTCVAEWTAPVPAATMSIPPLCTVFISKLRLEDTTGALKWKSRVRMWYSRTWVEINPSGDQLQVWRFLLNGDLKEGTAAGPAPCPTPPCSAAFGGRVRYTGYMDIALNCTTGLFSHAWMLNHECDRIDHFPGFPRSGPPGYHQDRSYTFVGPAAGFVPDTGLPFEAGTGTTIGDHVRHNELPVPGTAQVCFTEEPVTISDYLPQFQLCVCGSGPSQYAYANVRIVGECGTTAASTLQFPKGFVSKSLGRWTDPGVFPGVEAIRWNWSGYQYDNCVGIGGGDVFYGATSIAGYDAFELTSGGVGGPLLKTFIDQQNSLSYPGPAPLYNVEFVSDEIISLNLP